MDKNGLKKASKRFEEVFGELPADYGYPVIRVWRKKVLFARSAEAVDAFISAQKTLTYTSPNLIALVFVISLLVCVCASIKWEEAWVVFCAFNIIVCEIARVMRKKAHKAINKREQMVYYNPKDNCIYQL